MDVHAKKDREQANTEIHLLSASWLMDQKIVPTLGCQNVQVQDPFTLVNSILRLELDFHFRVKPFSRSCRNTWFNNKSVPVVSLFGSEEP